MFTTNSTFDINARSPNFRYATCGGGIWYHALTVFSVKFDKKKIGYIANFYCKVKKFKNIDWIRSHYLTFNENSNYGRERQNIAGHCQQTFCWQHPAMFCLYTSSKLAVVESDITHSRCSLQSLIKIIGWLFFHFWKCMFFWKGHNIFKNLPLVLIWWNLISDIMLWRCSLQSLIKTLGWLFFHFWKCVFFWKSHKNFKNLPLVLTWWNLISRSDGVYCKVW